MKGSLQTMPAPLVGKMIALHEVDMRHKKSSVAQRFTVCINKTAYHLERWIQHVLLPIHWTRLIVLHGQKLYDSPPSCLKKQVAPGELYVAKSASTAFVILSITSSVIDSEVLIDWRARSLRGRGGRDRICIFGCRHSEHTPATMVPMKGRRYPRARATAGRRLARFKTRLKFRA
jgi:hypothetical protein